MNLKNFKNRKGVLGIDTATAFVIALLILVVMAVVFIIVLGSLQTVTTTSGLIESGSRVNETRLLIDTGTDLSVAGLPSISVTNDIVTNSTGGEIVESANYTISGGIIFTSGAAIAINSLYNNTNLNISYDFTHSDESVSSIIGNATAGVEELFASTSTWFSLLAVVIIILIIVIVIVAIRGLGGFRGQRL